MKCPLCNQKLIKGKQKRLETLFDHICAEIVSNPNYIYPLRDTYICCNPGCKSHLEKCFWDIDGYFYNSTYPSNLKKEDFIFNINNDYYYNAIE